MIALKWAVKKAAFQLAKQVFLSAIRKDTGAYGGGSSATCIGTWKLYAIESCSILVYRFNPLRENLRLNIPFDVVC